METKAKLIMNAIKLDRSEIRLTRERIYTTVSYIAAASFAITAFLVGPQLTERDPLKVASLLVLMAIIDISLLTVLWGLFLRYMADLRAVHCSSVKSTARFSFSLPAAALIEVLTKAQSCA